MTFRDEGDAARARAEALERRLAEVEAENERLRARPPSGSRSADAPGPAASFFRRPSTWLGVTAALLGVAGLIELDGGRPPWDELLPILGALSISSVGMSILMLRSVAGPSELMILSGRRHRGPHGRDLGYRVIRPGCAVFRVPVVERLDRMDLRGIPLELELKGAVTADGVVTLRASATVAVTSRPERIGHAVERFLGASPGAVATAARQTLESAARATLARVATGELEREREKLAHTIRSLAEEDLEPMGLDLQAFALGALDR